MNKLRYQSSPLAYSIDAGGARSAFLVTLTWVVHAYSAGTDMVRRAWDLCGYALNAKGLLDVNDSAVLDAPAIFAMPTRRAHNANAGIN